MRVDFYQLGEESVEAAIPLLAAKVRQAGERLLIVAREADRREAISRALWEYRPEEFLAHGHAGQAHEERQPLLLSDECRAANGAGMVMFADGIWREGADDFSRVLLLFGEAEITGARAAWRMLDGRDGAERRYWKREGGRWVEGP